MHYHVMTGRKFTDLNIDEVVRESIYHAAHFLKAKPISSGKYSVVFSQRFGMNFSGNFQSIFSAKKCDRKDESLVRETR